MIAKGNTHDSGPKLVAYILTAQEGERVEFGGARGFDFFGADVRQAAAIMQQIADHTTNCRDAWFHTQTRLAPGEQLTPRAMGTGARPRGKAAWLYRPCARVEFSHR